MSAPQSEDLEGGLREASQLFDQGRVGEAFALLTDLEEHHATDPTLLCMLGTVAREMDGDSRAYDYFRRCLAEQPADPVVLVAAGTALADYDDPEAESALRLAALTAPDLPLARLQYGAYLAREGLFELAREELSAARRLDPDDPRAPRELAGVYFLSGRDAEGVEAMEEAAATAPEDAALRLLYGLALLRVGRLEEAGEELHRAAYELPQDAEAQLLFALAAAALEWTDEVWDALARGEAVADGSVLTLLQEVEDQLSAGPEAAAAFLQEQLAPSAFRERLLERS